MNEERIKELLKNTGREGIDDLISYMEENGFLVFVPELRERIEAIKGKFRV